MPNNVTVQELVDKVRLKVLQGEDYLQRKITTSDISRPALEFAGYFKHYPAARIQLLGITETSFAKDLTHEQREEYMTKCVCHKHHVLLSQLICQFLRS